MSIFFQEISQFNVSALQLIHKKKRCFDENMPLL